MTYTGPVTYIQLQLGMLWRCCAGFPMTLNDTLFRVPTVACTSMTANISNSIDALLKLDILTCMH